MRPFQPYILELLNALSNVERISHISLGEYIFSLGFEGNQTISGESKITFQIQGKTFVWEEGANEAPVWLLIGKSPVSFELIDEFTLRMTLDTGDKVDFHSDESPYESVVINLGGSDNKITLEVF